jgi:hypothetical protein
LLFSVASGRASREGTSLNGGEGWRGSPRSATRSDKSSRERLSSGGNEKIPRVPSKETPTLADSSLAVERRINWHKIYRSHALKFVQRKSKAPNSHAELKDARVIALFAQIPSSNFHPLIRRRRRRNASERPTKSDAISLTFFADKSKRAAYESLSKHSKRLFKSFSVRSPTSPPRQRHVSDVEDGERGSNAH